MPRYEKPIIHRQMQNRLLLAGNRVKSLNQGITCTADLVLICVYL